jgi:hypothetical protein
VTLVRLVTDGGIPLLRSTLLDQLPGISHAFTTRLGGASLGHYRALNLSLTVGDRAEDVFENRTRLANAVGVNPTSFVLQSQQHGAGVALLTGKEVEGSVRADAFVTNHPAIPAVVGVADCIPILCASANSSVVAAIHAGWRGVTRGVVARAQHALQKEFGVEPAELRVALGPHIGACCFEVGEEVAVQFPAGCVLRPSSPDTRFRVDLSAAVVEQLVELGVAEEQIDVCDLCTVCRRDILFSHRADNGVTGRMAGLIVRSV